LDLARAVAATGTPTVAVLIQGRPHALADLPERCAAILCAWYPGPAGGAAIAAALFGDVNPGGRLPVSIPRSSGVLPVTYNAKVHNHTDYLDAPGRAAYIFGFGLGYTSIEYLGVSLHPATIDVAALRAGATVNVRARVRNTGPVAGDEVVQLYTRRLISRVWPRTRELKSFRRITLAPGEQADVVLPLGRRELAVWLPGMEFDVEPGRQLITVGGIATELTIHV
jgi:beta-glucosidase